MKSGESISATIRDSGVGADLGYSWFTFAKEKVMPVRQTMEYILLANLGAAFAVCLVYHIMEFAFEEY